MVFKTIGNKSNPVIFFFPCNGSNWGKQYAGCRENGRKILLHYANIDCVLLRTEVSKQKR